MADTTATAAAQKPTRKETRASRLHRLLAALLPHDAKRITSGDWGKAGPPYQFKTKGDGRQQLLVTDPETESRIGFLGATRDELLDKLEAHVKQVTAPSAKTE